MNKLSRSKKIFLWILVLALLKYIIFLSLPITQELFRLSLESILRDKTQYSLVKIDRIEKAKLDHRFRIHIKNLGGSLISKEGPVPIEIREISSTTSLFKLFSRGLRLNFKGAHFRSSKQIGVNGNLKIKGIKKWQISLETDTVRIDLGDLVWLNPENLKGSTGIIEGNFNFDADNLGQADLKANFEVKVPGGNLQGKFFGLITPYLPTQTAKEVTNQLATSSGLIRYKTAGLNLNLIRSNQLKVILKILIPDYNLDLNLNLDIRLEDQNSLRDLIQLMGIVKAK